jgi:hypothetical protein
VKNIMTKELRINLNERDGEKFGKLKLGDWA